MTGHFALVCNLALLCALGILVNKLARTNALVERGATTPAMLSAGVAMSICQWPNLIEPFQIQFALLCVSLVGAAALAAKAASPLLERRRAMATAFGAGLCFLAATFSMAGGLLSLPWLTLIFLLRRARWPLHAAFLAVAVPAAGLFLYHYKVSSSPLTISDFRLESILREATFAAGFLGSALFAYGQVAYVLGFAGMVGFIAAFAAVCFLVFRQRAALDPGIFALLAICGTIFSISGAAALSRLSFGMSAALEPRYSTLSLLFWTALLPLIAQVLVRIGGAQAGRWLGPSRVMIVLPAALLLACNFNPAYRAAAIRLNNNLESEAESVRQNVYVAPLFAAAFYGGVNEAADRFRFLRKNKLAIFAPSIAKMPPALPADWPDRLPACDGQIDDLVRLDDTRAVVKGWLRTGQPSQSTDWLALLTTRHDIRAMIPATISLRNVRTGHRKIHVSDGFYSGVALGRRGDDENTKFFAVGLTDGRSDAACRWPVALEFPLLALQGLSGLSDPHTFSHAIPVDLQGAFRPNGVTSMAPITAPFRGETMYASGAAGDAATGQMSFKVTPDESDIAVPFATGPSVVGQSMEAGLSDGTVLLYPVPNEAQDGNWRALVISHRVIAAHGGGSVTVRARDSGTGWGQWLAVATPMGVKPRPDGGLLY